MESGENGQNSQIAHSNAEQERKKEQEYVMLLLQKERERIVLGFLMTGTKQRTVIPSPVLVSISSIF